ncbi:MAG: flagellar hook-basal body complex protein FliE [Propionibacteriales bacterium]|jgi:flagellar hook-basal body complex protein FliE|nr:flagellar hook-basal body complex protein FliE [Propionibacteriales bacterium]
MSISGIGGVGFTPYVAPQVSAPAAAKTAGPDHDFGNLVLDGIDRLERVQDTSDQLAVKAATGDLNAIHDYTIAATEANVTTQLTVAVRNKAVDAFNEIMRMQV